MLKFPKVLGFLNLKSGSDPVSEANLQAAEDKISQLEQEKTTAETNLTTAQTALKTAEDEKAKATTALADEQQKTATLQEWKDNQKAVDNREDDESNKLDEKPEATEPWEKAAASAVATAKRRVGEK